MWGDQKMTSVLLYPKQILKDQLKMVYKKKGSEGEKIKSEIKSSKEESVVSVQEKNRELGKNKRENFFTTTSEIRAAFLKNSP